MKKIIVTGCSHSAGVERSDSIIFKDYEGFLEKSKKWIDTSIHSQRLIHQINFLRKNTNNKKFHKRIVRDLAKTGKITSRYFRLLDRSLSWPARLQQQLPGNKVINFAKGGSSFKMSVHNTLKFCSQSTDRFIAIHQVPTHTRNYFKFGSLRYEVTSMDTFEFKEKVFKNNNSEEKLLEKAKEKYKNLIRRDVQFEYFKKSIKRYLACLEKHSTGKIENYFILEDDTQKALFPNKRILIDNFEIFRQKYRIGANGHVVDENFQKDLVELVISKISL